MTLRWEWDTQGLGGPSRTPTPHLPVQGSGACSGAAETKRLCQNQTTLLLCLELGCGLQAADPPPESALWRQEDLDGPTAQWVVSRLPGPAWLSAGNSTEVGEKRPEGPNRGCGNSTNSNGVSLPGHFLWKFSQMNNCSLGSAEQNWKQLSLFASQILTKEAGVWS